MVEWKPDLMDMHDLVREKVLTMEVAEEFHAAQGHRPWAKNQRDIITGRALMMTLRLLAIDESASRKFCANLANRVNE